MTSIHAKAFLAAACVFFFAALAPFVGPIFWILLTAAGNYCTFVAAKTLKDDNSPFWKITLYSAWGQTIAIVILVFTLL